jgi:UbiD family decarboxylase
LRKALSIGVGRRRRGPVTEIAEAADLTALPFTQSWSQDGGAFATLPLVYTEPPGGGPPNLGIYRMHRFDSSRTGMHWQIGKGGGFHHAAAEQIGQPLPVTVFLGGPPAALLGALAPLPENVPELLLVSVALGERLPMVRRGDWPHPLLAEAEWCLLGEVLPGERHPEGPFGDHYGYYSLQHDFPVFHCRRVFRRSRPIFPATVVGKPRQEDFYLGDYLQRVLSPLFPLVMPAVEQLWSYGETGYHALAAAQVKERYRREAMASAFRILGEGQLALTKFLLVVDQDLDLANFPAVLEHLLARTRVETDLFVFANLSMDTLDYAGPALNEGSKGVWLGLGSAIRQLPRQWSGPPPAGVQRLEVYCAGCLVVEGEQGLQAGAFAQRLAQRRELEDWPLVVLTDDARRSVASDMNFLWSTFTRFDPAADLHSGGGGVQQNHLVRKGPIVLDARMKPAYPEELLCDEETAGLVSQRWGEYFSAGGVEMGDSTQGHLTASS